MATFDYAKPLEGEEQFLDCQDGTRLRTVTLGSGEQTVVLAHGFASGADAWNVMAPKLADQGFRVIAFDQRGHGQSTIGNTGAGTAQMVTDYEAVFEAFDLDNAILVGHSMGGFLAIAFMLDGLDTVTSRVGSLVLMATFAGDVNRQNPQNKFQIPLIRSGVLQRLMRFDAVGNAFTKSLIGDGYEREMAGGFVPTFQAADHPNLIPVLQAMVDESRYDRLDQITVPCTVIVGDKDKTTPPFHTADLHAGITGSKLVTLPGVGHGPNWEAPDAVVAAITELATRT